MVKNAYFDKKDDFTSKKSLGKLCVLIKEVIEYETANKLCKRLY